MGAPSLIVERLTTSIRIDRQWFDAVRDVSFEVHPRETLALVGESGCGKSLTALSIMGLLPEGVGRVSAGRITVAGTDMTAASAAKAQAMRGDRIGMIFQEPMTSLNPVTTVGSQVMEAIELHADLSRAEARNRVIELFGLVGIPDAKSRFSAYPHQLSGGLKQRIMIAMAMALRPRLLIADEPTTALDATIRAQILELLRNLSATTGTAVLLITHDFGVVNEVADRVAVMYAGQIVEEGTRSELLARPHHPYAQCLLRSIPRPEARGHRLEEIKGGVPRPGHWPGGCRFHPRCPLAFEPCPTQEPVRTAVSPSHAARCHLVAREAGA
jgi:oligopeptide/dipeptide ABC transporter ATP-binding protein